MFFGNVRFLKKVTRYFKTGEGIVLRFSVSSLRFSFLPFPTSGGTSPLVSPSCGLPLPSHFLSDYIGKVATDSPSLSFP